MRRLQELTRALLDSGADAYTLRPEVLELTSILSDAETSGFLRKELIGEGETLTPEGLALSPTNAVMCADDYLRTIRFIRGLHAAIIDRKKRHSGRPVRVLYAGCGPYATLAIPLMSVLSSEAVTFTLVDIHAESIDAVKSIVKSLGYVDYVSAFQVADAGSYRIARDRQPDIVLMEIMQSCLKNEPQVSVTRHLMRQAPDAVLIPAEVRIELKLVDLSREFTLHYSEQDVPGLHRDRIHVDTLFRLNREAVASWNDGGRELLPAAVVQIPELPESRYQLMLFTIVDVFGDNTLRDYDSGLTVPRAIRDQLRFEPGDTVEFYYQCGAQPGLTCRVLEQDRERNDLGPGPSMAEWN